MKKLLIITLSILGILSCNKDKFLATKQEGSLNFNAYFANAQQAENSVNAIYNVLQWDHVHGQLDWVYGDVMSDDTYKGGENDADQPLMREMELYLHNPGNAYIASTWSQLYQGIFRANVVLSRIDEVPADMISNGYRERLRAETKFLRAYFYFRLNIMFGGVPLITELLSSDKYTQPRATETAVWNQIEKDLKEAIPYLPKDKYATYDAMHYNPKTDLGRASLAAAQTLLCKVYLYQKRWSEARIEAENVINSGIYYLYPYLYPPTDTGEPKFDNIFDLEHEECNTSCRESIFEVHCGGLNYKYDYVYGWGNGDLGTLMNVYWLSRLHDGWGFNIPTDDLANEYEAADKRRKFGTIVLGSPNLIYPDLKSYNIGFNGQTRGPRKYIVPRTLIGSALSQGPSNFRIFRYADVLLMHAEACANLGDEAAATASLMELRTKRGLTTMAPDVISGKKFDDGTYRDVVIGSTVLEKIYHERRVELALEGQRFFDLVRWGLADKKLTPLGYHWYNAKFPIPQGEIDISGLEQNPGY